MESGENYRLSGVSFSSSPNVWRVSGATEYFSKSKSSFDEVVDDEEALKWASIERLPTTTRLRTSVLTEDGGGTVREVDVKHLNAAERRNVLERLVQFDNEKFLLKFKDRIQRVGVTYPTVEVRFENLSVETQAYVGGRALPTIGNSVVNIFESILKNLHVIPSRKTLFAILNDVSGLLKPGRMALLLGPPGSGKTTLLKALAGEPDKDLKVHGKITYNGHEMHEFVPQRTSSYISQHDLHIGELTVRETLAFSARCQGVGSRHDILVELSHREKEANIMPDPDLDIIMKAAALEGQETNVVTDYIMKILGLEVCADTLVGNEMIRGISGGQMKRVTAGEMMVGASKVFLMDEISTGLDSSTTFQIVNSIKQSIHILQGTAVIALLQPAPETYDLFDDIILLSEGLIVYQGPRETVLEFFETMGFKCPPRKGVADFLQEVTSRKDQEQYWLKKDEPYEFVTVKKFSEAFNSFHVGMSLRAELAVPFDKTKSHPAALTTKKYGVSNIQLLKACMAREFLLMKRNSFVYVFATAKLFLVAVIAMTLFLRTHMHKDTTTNGTVYMGALFFTLLSVMFSGFAETALTIMRLPVFYKQRDLFFYPAWAYVLPTWLLRIPITLLESTVWVGMTYYVIGFDPNVSRFLRQYLLLICVSLMASGLFRFIGSIGRNMIVANTFGSFAILAVMVLGGFVISHDNIKKWWIWGYWISPLMYAQNAIAVNEFLGNSWGKVLPGIKETLGVTVLKSRGIFAEAHWYWVGVGAMIGYMFLFNFIYALALTYLNPLEKTQAIICFVLDLRSIPSWILRDLKLLKVAYTPRGYFNLRDFHHAVNSLPTDAFCPEFSIAQPLPSNAEMKVSDVLNDKLLYSWGGQDKDISKKVVLICCYVIQNLDHDTKNVLMEAADKCVSVEYVFIENPANHLGDVADNINSFTKQIGDLENCSFRSYLSDAYVFSVLAKQWFQELKDDTKGLLQCRFIFRTDLIHQVDHISCNLHPSLIPITDGFTSCQMCRCHGVPLNRSNKNLNKSSLACPVTGNELDQSDVIDNSVHVGENTILCMPSFRCCQRLPQISSPIDFNVLERTNLGSLSEGVIFGSSFVVAPSTYHELDDIEKAERNNQVFLALCHVLNSVDQGLVCCSNCNLETMTETAIRCYYVLLPSDKGMMLLRRLVASEELLPLLDFKDAIASKVGKEMEDSVRDSLLKIEARDYNPIQHERGFHQKLNLLVKESLQFGAMPVKAKEVATGLDITSPDSDILQPVQGSNVEENTEERIPKLTGEVGVKKSNERLAEEWEQLIVTELPKIHSPTQFSQVNLDCLVLSPTQSLKQIDEKTSRILERLEVPKQLKRKTVSPTNLAIGNSDPCLLRKKPLIPYGLGHHDNDQGVSTSQPIKPTFQRLKRKK